MVKPKGKHQATIVWLHGLGDNGSRYELVHISVTMMRTFVEFG